MVSVYKHDRWVLKESTDTCTVNDHRYGSPCLEEKKKKDKKTLRKKCNYSSTAALSTLNVFSSKSIVPESLIMQSFSGLDPALTLVFSIILTTF